MTSWAVWVQNLHLVQRQSNVSPRQIFVWILEAVKNGTLKKHICLGIQSHPAVQDLDLGTRFQRDTECSRYTDSESCSSERPVLKRIVPARTVPAGTWSNHVLGTNRPLVHDRSNYEHYEMLIGTNSNNVLSGRGLARSDAVSARRVHIKMTSHVCGQCDVHNTCW